jgi:hypothetical protein
MDGFRQTLETVLYLCHSTRAEAVDSLVAARGILEGLPDLEFRKRPFVYQHDELIDTPTIGGEGQQQARV